MVCGICGYFNINDEGVKHPHIVEQMLHTLNHRGPDEFGITIKDNVALGFTRLSIVDIQGGQQPLRNEDGTITLICNGEIFNYLELREQLIAKGHIFKTMCDVEVIVHLYEEYRLGFLDYLNGQFALAIYDSVRKQLVCARDHAGIAPFFYTIANNTFIFASEIKAILQHKSVNKRVDLTGLDQIMHFPGLVSPRTLFEGVYSLEGGHYLLVDSTNGVRKSEYWDLKYPMDGEADAIEDENYYIEKMDALLNEAVKRRLQADVPVGFYISGGIDSSIIAAKIKHISGKRLHSFSVAFADKSISEAKYQRLMAEVVGSIHHELSFNHSHIIEYLRRTIYHSECALKESYNTASFALSQVVRQNNVKVILTGEGADELFGGYIGYRFDQMKLQQARATGSVNKQEELIRKILWGDETFLYERNHHEFIGVARRLYSEALNENYSDFSCLNSPIIDHRKIMDLNVFHKRSYIDFKLRMSDHLLADHGDRMCFANSVEARYPFLDLNIIEFARTMPVSMKIKNFKEKYILKKVAEKIVPSEIINRPKFAFVAPGSPEILQNDSDYIEDLLSYDRIKRQGYFNPTVVEELKKEYSQKGYRLNVPYDNDLLITVITFGLFLDEFHLA